jgi:hypothetical protein
MYQIHLPVDNINEVSGYDGLCLSHNGPFDNSLLKDLKILDGNQRLWRVQLKDSLLQ